MSQANQCHPVVNPSFSPHNEGNMCGQSQQQIRDQAKRKHEIASNNSNKKRKGGQLSLFGGAAFAAE